jgi:ADP-ribose pyrophosphatase YjhB (NUDIX family)
MARRKTQIVVSAAIVSGSKVLLVKHTKLKKWLLPGGHLKANEIPDDAVVREVKEETNLDFKFLDYSKLAGSSDEIETVAMPYYATFHSVGDHDHYCLCYRGRAKNVASLRGNRESSEIGWFNAKQVKELKDAPESVKRVAISCLSG